MVLFGFFGARLTAAVPKLSHNVTPAAPGRVSAPGGIAGEARPLLRVAAVVAASCYAEAGPQRPLLNVGGRWHLRSVTESQGFLTASNGKLQLNVFFISVLG